MNIIKNFPRVSLIATMLILVFSATSFAASGGAPAVGASGENNGLRTWGNASGDKLEGSIHIVFDNIKCKTGDSCSILAATARARVSLLLSRTKNQKVTDDSKEVIPDYYSKAFFVEFNDIELEDAGIVQDFITGSLENRIISEFDLEVAGVTKQVYLKSVSRYFETECVCEVPVPCDDDDAICGYVDAACDDGADHPPFASSAEIVLAVDTPGQKED